MHGYTKAQFRTAAVAVAFMLSGGCPAAQSLAEYPVTTLNDNGGWCWFQDERAIVVDEKLFVGSVANRLGTDGAARGGNIELTTLDLAKRGRPTTTVLHAGLENDDHDAPALVALPDGRILAVYATHGSDKLVRYRLSSGSEDGTAWEPERQVMRDGGVTYSNLFFLPKANQGQGRLYNFYRGEHWNPNWITSDDLGASWQYGGRLIAFEGRPYVKYASNSRDAIHFVMTEHHPHNYPNSLYHGYLKAGRLHRSDSTVICPVSDAPIRPEQATVVFAGDTDHVAWMCDVHLDANERPCVVYSVQRQLDPNDISYRYTRWDGQSWRNHFLAHAGTALYQREAHYSGLVALDPADLDRLYLSTDADPMTGQPLISRSDGKRHYEIFAGRTADSGVTWTWTPITKDSDVDNLRPIVPLGGGRNTILLWLQGTYTSYTQYDLDIVGIILDGEIG